MCRFLWGVLFAACLPIGALAEAPDYCALTKSRIKSACDLIDSFVRAGLTTGYKSDLKPYNITLRTENQDLIIDFKGKELRAPYQGPEQCQARIEELTILTKDCEKEIDDLSGKVIIQYGDTIVILRNDGWLFQD